MAACTARDKLASTGVSICAGRAARATSSDRVANSYCRSNRSADSSFSRSGRQNDNGVKAREQENGEWFFSM